MTEPDEKHRERSEFIRRLIHMSPEDPADDNGAAGQIPKTLVQFWHDLSDLPPDVEECISSWARWGGRGFSHCLFDVHSARQFINDALGARHGVAFQNCYHPAMQADYFRLCFLTIQGGFYADADDICVGSKIGALFVDGRLKVQPLCYDVASNSMVEPAKFQDRNLSSSSWIYYFNNSPLIARPRHPVLERALEQATGKLQIVAENCLPEIQSTTGPGNLSQAIFELGMASREAQRDILVLQNWDSLAFSKWPLSYRSDARNWRNSNQKRFPGLGTPAQ